MASQGLASAISLVLTIFTAREVSAEAYGVFAVALTSAYFIQGLIRALTSEVLVFRHSAAEGEDRDALTSACLSASAAYGAVFSIIAVVAGIVLNDSFWIAFAFALLGLVVQDNFRFVLMAHGKSKLATILDGIALIASVALLLAASVYGELTAFLLAWGSASWIAGLVGFALLKPRLRMRNLRAWHKMAWHESKFFASDFMLTNAVSTGAVYFIAIMLGAVAAGQIRAASMLILPVLLLTRGLILTVASETNRLVAARKYKSVRNIGLALSGASVGITLLWIPIVWLIPISWMEFLLGDSAQGAADVFPFVAIATAAAGLAAGPNIILKAAGRVRTAFTGKVVALPLSVGGVVTLSVIAGAAGSQVGLAVGEAARAIWGWAWAASWLKSRVSEEADSKEVCQP
ncbi:MULTISPECIES: hypothetical protein [unclassified Pseudarthrobacter]|uniref:hypothetical protein n=1 Tax=unclassified Pseudarthrobacter TaxID=2647000 RepID=UPI00363356DE